MDDVRNNQGNDPIPDSEEVKQEEEALLEVDRDDLRSQVIEKYQLSEDEQSDLIDALVEDNLMQRETLGKAIKQKRSWRQKAQEAPAKKSEDPKPAPAQSDASADELLAKAEAKVREEFEKRDLESLDLPDEIKSEVQKLAKAQGISVREAAKDAYIEFQKEQYEAKQREEEATPTRTKKGTKVKFDSNNPPEVDLSTDEGRKTWEEYTDWLTEQQNQ